MEAEGDPTVISLSVKALKPKNGPLMSLIQYKPYSANEQLFAWMYLDEQEEVEQEAEEQ
jgi:hypothetical protein